MCNTLYNVIDVHGSSPQASPESLRFNLAHDTSQSLYKATYIDRYRYIFAWSVVLHGPCSSCLMN